MRVKKDPLIAAEAFLAALPQQALNAYEDQCAPANPRMPMLEDMKDLMLAAYHGTSFTEVRRARLDTEEEAG